MSAAGAARGLSIWSIPDLSRAVHGGDDADRYDRQHSHGRRLTEWAFIKPIRKLYYNLTVTFVSIFVALVIGAIEALGVIGDQFKLDQGFWRVIGLLNDNFGTLGFVIIGIFVASWILSALIYRINGYDRIEQGSATAD